MASVAHDVLNLNCDCFRTEVILVRPKIRKISNYILSQQQRINSFLQEIDNHRLLCVGETKSCFSYGAKKTSASQLLISYSRHKDSIFRLSKQLKNFNKSIFIKLRSGSEAPIKHYVAAIKGLVNGLHDNLIFLANDDSTVKLKYLIKSENLHKTTLDILQHVIDISKNHGSQLEKLTVTPVGICPT